MRDKIREAIETGKVLYISKKDMKNITPEDVILIYIAYEKDLITLNEYKLEKIKDELGIKNFYVPISLQINRHKNIFARILFDVLVDGDTEYTSIKTCDYPEYLKEKPEYIKLFTHLTAKYNLDNYYIHHIWFLLLAESYTLSDETMTEFNHQLNGSQVKSAKR